MNELRLFSHLGFTYTTYITVKSEFLNFLLLNFYYFLLFILLFNLLFNLYFIYFIFISNFDSKKSKEL